MTSGDDSKWLILAIALVSAFFIYKEGGVKEELNSCKIEFQGFKEGVVYGRGR